MNTMNTTIQDLMTLSDELAEPTGAVAAFVRMFEPHDLDSTEWQVILAKVELAIGRQAHAEEVAAITQHMMGAWGLEPHRYPGLWPVCPRPGADARMPQSPNPMPRPHGRGTMTRFDVLNQKGKP